MVVPVISRSRIIVGESTGFAEFLVQLSVPSTQTVSVQYYTSDGEASDYNGINTTTLSFAPGETVKTVSISLTNDTAVEQGGPFHFTLINPTHATIDTGLTASAIPDNDGTLPDVGMSTAVQSEGAPPTITQALGDSLPLPDGQPVSAAADVMPTLYYFTALESNGLFVANGALSDSGTAIQSFAAAPLPTITQAQVAQLVDGFEQMLTKIESNLIAQVFGDSLPLLGDNLADAAAGGASALHYVTALKAALNNGLAALTGSATYTEAQVELALYNALNTAGIASGAGPQIDLTNLDDIKLTMGTSKAFAAFDAALDAGFGLPGLGIQASGTAHSVFNYTLNFGVGLDTDGFYLNTANTATFNAGFTTTLTGLDVAADFSQLHFQITDESATDGDSVAPTSFTGFFAIDLLDPSGADNKLRIGELTAGADLLNATLNANANVNLNLASDLGTAVLPDLAADLNYNWSFSNSTVDVATGNAGFGNAPTVAFKNVSLGLGSFFSDFVNPVLDQVQILTAPLQPIVDVLQTRIGFLSDLAGKDFTLLDLAGGIGALDQETKDRLELYGNLITFINATRDGGTARIDLGDFSLGANDSRGAGFLLANMVPQSTRTAIAAGLQNSDTKNFLDAKNGLQGGGMAFPIIEDPKTAINLLFGKPVDFFTYHVPGLNIDNKGYNDFYRLFGPFGVRLEATVDAHAHLDIGYDSSGIGTGDPEDIFNGFYVVDQPGAEGILTANLKAFAAVNVVLAEMGVGGGIEGNLNAFLNDLDGTVDGRIHLAMLTNSCEFVTLSGEVTAGLSAYLTVGWGLFSETFEKDFGHEVLASFNTTGCGAAGAPGVPVLAHNAGTSVALHVGADASLQVIGSLQDSTEDFVVFHVSGLLGSETVAVIGNGLLTETNEKVAPQNFTVGANGRITGNGGDKDDKLALALEVLSPATLHGGAGSDLLVGGRGDDDLSGDAGLDALIGGIGSDTLNGGADQDYLDGQDGDDNLLGGSEADMLHGGAGADTLDGGPGFDTATYFLSPIGVQINLAAPGSSTGDALGDSYIAIERIVGSSHADIMLGTVGSNNFGGDAGDDLLDGKEGDDLLSGDAGADQLVGGTGNDFAAYTLSPAAVAVSLFTGLGNGGDAQGDTLSGIENLQGSDFGDTLEGDNGANWLRGLNGNNTLRGLGGNDLLEGGKDGDTLEGGDGLDTLRASLDVASLDALVSGGIDTLRGGAGDDFLYGDAGGDLLDGGDGADKIYGGKDSDTVLGGAGDDLIYGGVGNESVDGGSGNDLLDGGTGMDTLNDLAGNNQFFGGVDDDQLTAGAGNDLLDGGTGNDRLAAGDGTNTLAGGDGNDELLSGGGLDGLDGGTGNDRLNAGDGTNTLTGGDGDDELLSGSGADNLDGGTGKDQLDAGDGTNTLTGGDGDDGLLSGTGADNLDGGLGNDTANSGAGNDIVLGSDGNDILDAGIGADRVDGGAGVDFLSVGALRGPVQDPNRLDHLFGGLGFDTITADFSNQTAPVIIVAGLTQSVVFADSTEARDFENVHDLFTGSGDDSLRLDGAADDRFANLLKTGAGNDTIYSGAGNDNVDAGDGDDFVNGGSDTGTMIVMPGTNIVTGTLYTGGSGDTLVGGTGNDTVSFDQLDYQIRVFFGEVVGWGVDVNLGTNATDRAARGISISGFENVIGTNNADVLTGSDGANIIQPLRGGGWFSSGSGGPDYIDGVGGEDTLRIDFSLADLADAEGVQTNAQSIFRLNLDHSKSLDSYYYSNIEHLEITGASKDDTLYPWFTGINSDIFSGLGGNDMLGGGGGADTLLGGDGNDTLSGQGTFAAGYNGIAGGHDVFDGGAGDDLVEDIAVSGFISILGADTLFQLDGGTGFDTLSADFSNQAAIVWDSAAPTNMAFADGAYARNFEALRYFTTGAGNDVITQGGRFDNRFYLGAGDDKVNPGLGMDTVDGGAGFDTATLDFSVGDTALMAGVQGDSNGNGGSYFRPLATDLFNRPDNIVLSNFERIHITGTSKSDNIAGIYGDDTLIGGDGNDVLNGWWGGNSVLDGGNGDDTLIGAYPNYSGTGTGGGNDTMLGGFGADTLFGNHGDDILRGGDGNDVISAGDRNVGGGYVYGVDVIDGGAGNDVITDGHFVSDYSYATAGTRMQLDGGAGFDTLSADFGNQTQAITFIGGTGNSLDFADGSYFRNFEALSSFTAGAGNDTLTASGRAVTNLTGGAGNDTINPGLGIDFASGGAGDDLLILDYSAGDEANVSGVTFNGTHLQRRDLNTNALLDSIYLTGFERYQITGSGKADFLVGGSFADVLTGNAGNDTLSGGTGNDTLIGGAGDDTYLVDAVGDVVTEFALGGTDTVQTTLGSYSLAALVNVENLTYMGGGAFTGTGNAAANAMTGGASGDMLDAGSGDDTLDGKAGIDTMTGGDGSDSYYIDNIGDLVTETNAVLASGGNDTVYSTLPAYTLTANVENLRLLAIGAANGTGNGLNNTLYAGAGDNVLDGSTGIDTASYADAAAGITVSLASGIAQVTGGSGSDTLISIENLIGGNASDKLTGNNLANILDGGAGADSMIGGDKSDSYYVDNAADLVVETNASLAVGGNDTVYSTLSAYTLAANVENLRLLATGAANGTGNGLNNTLFAGAGNNVLNGGAGIDTASYAYATSRVTVSLASGIAQITGGSGSDTLISIENLTGGNARDKLTGNNLANTLDGGLGADTMIGGDKSDIYYIDNIGDLVTETNTVLASGGNDSVYSSLAAYTLTANVENLRLLATGVANGTGNGLNNTLYAGAGNNVLDGGLGIDTVSYAYAAAGVTVSLASGIAQATGGSGSDKLASIENLIGSNANDKLTGNGLTNRLDGGVGKDILAGGAGNDTLAGGAGNDKLNGDAGADKFVFGTALNNTTNMDEITGFNITDDTLVLENAIFTKFAVPGAVAAGNFVSGAGVAAVGADDYLLYNTATGVLSYDADGSGAGAAVQFVTLIGIPAVTAANFLIV